MKTKVLKIKHRGEHKEINYIEFESAKEVLKMGDDRELLKLINYGSRELAKLTALGKDPFKPRKKLFKVDITKLSQDQVDVLKQFKILNTEE